MQVYYQPSDRSKPVRLVGWSAIEAEPGQAVRAEIDADSRLWRRWDTDTATWQRLPPGGELLVARGLGDVRGVLPLDAS